MWHHLFTSGWLPQDRALTGWNEEETLIQRTISLFSIILSTTSIFTFVSSTSPNSLMSLMLMSSSMVYTDCYTKMEKIRPHPLKRLLDDTRQHSLKAIGWYHLRCHCHLTHVQWGISIKGPSSAQLWKTINQYYQKSPICPDGSSGFIFPF